MTRQVITVLSGGGAKTAAHVGALRALRDAGIVPTRYVATSMGAVIAALLAGGSTLETVLERLLQVRRRDVARLRAAGLVQGIFAGSLFHPEPLQRTIERLVPHTRFADLSLPLTITAADLDTSELVCFGSGGEDVPLHDALYAACALPLWYPPAVLGGRRLADGGVRSVLPLQPALRFPADLVIGIDTGPGTDATPATGRLAAPPLVRMFAETMHSLMSANTELALALWRAEQSRPPLIYIRPETERGATFSVHDVPRYERAGYEAARRALARVRLPAPGRPAGAGPVVP